MADTALSDDLAYWSVYAGEMEPMIVQAATSEQATEAVTRAAGYASIKDAADVVGKTPDEYLAGWHTDELDDADPEVLEAVRDGTLLTA